MNAKKLLFFLCVFVQCQVFGQSAWPPVFEITADTSVPKLETVYWQVLEDPGGKLSLADVVSPIVSNKFHPDNSSSEGVGYSGVKHYWQRFRLRNKTSKDIKLVFENVPEVSRFDMYVFRADGKSEHKISGFNVPNHQRDSFYTEEAVRVSLAAGEEVIVYKKLSLFYQEFFYKHELGYSTYEEFLNQEYFSAPFYLGDARSAFIAGFMFFGFFLNLFFFLINREKVYFFYALFLLLEGIWYLSLGTWFIFRSVPLHPRYFDLVITFNLFFFSVTHFVRHFLKTYRYYPRWDRLLISLNVLLIILSFSRVYTDLITPYSWRGIPAAIQNGIFFLANFSLLISFFFPKKEKDRFTTLSVIAAVPAFTIWSIIYGAGNIIDFLKIRFDIEPSGFLVWLDNNSFQIEMYCVAWFAILFTWILLQRYALLRKQLTIQALEREKERSELMKTQTEVLEKQVRIRTSELEQSIDNLKSTQEQLVQSEKMASLGELTAGIAHEIQNPLNFVNNFSEVNKELINEMNQLLDEGKIEEAKNLARDIENNEEKIVEHGRRADGIVKSMLQHSRSSAGNKELTDINAIAEEYLRLAYHGLRAKEKSFNAAFETDFDPEVGKINIVSQDIGRVLLNLINNAFYAVNEKKRLSPGDYDPVVRVTTKATGKTVHVSIWDNGEGIPPEIKDKIFQPFFTTKPAGQGTGLGLSLCYDIVKSHNGELTVETKKGEGSVFTIVLPSE